MDIFLNNQTSIEEKNTSEIENYIQKTIYIESGYYEGLTDTERIDKTTADAARTNALHMLMSFSGNLPEEAFLIKDTVIEIGVNEEKPVFLGNQAIFGYHRTTSPKYGLIIENTKVNAPGGIEWFFRASTNASGSADRARERVNQVIFVNNKEMKHLRRFYCANPYNSSCSDCNVYTYHEVTMKGSNSYYNLNGNLHEVTPHISPGDIWRSAGGTFSGCACENDILKMYLFEVKEKK